MKYAAYKGMSSRVEKMPEFPGGEAALMKFLSNNIRYPDESKNANIQGTVYGQFVIDSEGNVTQVKIFRSVSPDLDAECIRVISAMPRWDPGIQDGIPVKVQCNLPIRFTLNTGRAKKKKKGRN